MNTQGILSKISFFSLLLVSQTSMAQNIGVKTSTPLTTLDVNGSIAMREGTPLSIANGTNNNVAIDTMSFYRITVPTAVFTITGFSNGYDGRVLILVNATSYAMTLTHQASSSAANQINTGGSNVTVAANGVATLIYNNALTKWVLTGGQGFVTSPSSWTLTGNSGTTAGTNFVGTTDAVDFITKTNGTERMRVTSAGQVGIGTTTPTAMLEVDIAAGGTVIPLRQGVYVYGGFTSTNGYKMFEGVGGSTYCCGTIYGLKLDFTSGTNGTYYGLHVSGETYNYLSKNLGINNATPQYKLDIDANTNSTGNPLRLQGLQVGATSDSIVSSNSGILRRLSIPQVIANAWNITGNSGTTAGTNFVGTTDAQDLVFKANSAEGMRLTNGGNVGINITTPLTKLQVAETSTGSFRGILSDQYSADALPPRFNMRKARGTIAVPTAITTNDGIGSLAYGGYTGSSFVNSAYISGYAAEAYTPTATGSYLSIITTPTGSTSAVERIRVSANGTIGMGTGSPYTNVQIHGSGTSGYSPTGTTSVPSPGSSAELGFSNGGFSKPAATIQMIDYNGYSGGLAFNVHKGTANSAGGTFADNWPTDVVQAMTIVNNGQIGIGTSDPSYKLDIDAKTGGTGNPLRLQGLQAGTITDSIVSSNGGVLRRLSIAQVAGSSGWGLTGNSGTTAGTNFVGTTDAQDLVFKTNNAEGMRLTNGGNMGIGTTSPAYKFHIEEPGGYNGDMAFRLYNTNNSGFLPSLILQSSRGTKASPTAVNSSTILGAIRYGGYDGTAFTDVSAAELRANATENWSATSHGTSLNFGTISNGTTTLNNRMIIDHNGNVGIGIASPTQKLDVGDGNILLSNTGSAGELRFAEPSAGGTHYTAFKAQLQAASVTYSLPAAAPTIDGQVLTSTTAGVMSYANMGVTTTHGMTTPAAFTGTQNNYALLSTTATVYRISGSSTPVINGIVAGADGRQISIINITATSITLNHQSASATAANRFILKGAIAASLATEGMITFIYDATTARWREMTRNF